MKKSALILACLGMIAATALADKPVPQLLGPGKLVTPIKVGRLGPDRTVTEWREQSPRGDCDWRLVFDCFEPDVGGEVSGYDGYPIGYTSCGAGEPEDNTGNRWWFGATYCSMYTTNDMSFDPAYTGLAERIEVAWYWFVNGPGSGENMAVMIETFEEFDDTCTLGDPDGQGEWLGGVIVDFGYTEGDPGYFLYTDIDLCGLDWVPLPADGVGSYKVWIMTYDDANPDELFLATCAQAMLWGTGDGEYPIPDTVNRGEACTQGPIQWEDADADSFHAAPDECYDLTYGLCPDPLGAAACFYIDESGGQDCVGDLDGDGMTGQSDLGILLGDWGCSGGNCAGDLDGDGATGQSDLGILLGDWGCPG